jgi:hypothetical protein
VWFRYGFFSSSHPSALACQHNRLALLNSAPYSVLPSKFGSIRRPLSTSTAVSRTAQARNRAGSTSSLLTPSTPASRKLELSRIDKWGEMLTVGSRDAGRNVEEWKLDERVWDERNSGKNGKVFKRLQRRIFKGVPDRWRRAVWGVETERFVQEDDKGDDRRQKRRPSLTELVNEYKVGSKRFCLGFKLLT